MFNFLSNLRPPKLSIRLSISKSDFLLVSGTSFNFIEALEDIIRAEDRNYLETLDYIPLACRKELHQNYHTGKVK